MVLYLLHTGNGSGLVEIESTTGEMRSTATFDHEALDEFSVLVVAYDGGSPPLSATATVNVFITDVKRQRSNVQSD